MLPGAGTGLNGAAREVLGRRARPRGCHVARAATRETHGKSRDASRASGREGGEGPARPGPGRSGGKSARDGNGDSGEFGLLDTLRL